MSRRRARSVDDMDDLLPDELIASSSGSTVKELKVIVDQLEEQLEEIVDKYEKKIQDLTSRLESIETDFIQVIEGLKNAQGGAAPAAGPSSTSQPSAPPSTGGSQPPSLG